MKKAVVRHFPNIALLSRAAALLVANIVSRAAQRFGHAALVLSGGSTPAGLYELLATAYRQKLPWEKIHFFWGDERFVAPGRRSSNYALAFETLLSRVPVCPEKIHPIPVRLGWRASALSYDSAVKRFFAWRSRDTAGRAGCFDLVLLGIGQDGHTASLFPGSAAFGEERMAAAVRAPAGVHPARRITLTPAALNATGQALFLAAEEKRDIVHRIFEAGEGPGGYPAAEIHPRGKLSVFIAD